MVLLFVRPRLRRRGGRLSMSGSAMAGSRDHPQQVYQRGRRELARIHINRRRDVDGRDKPSHRCAPNQSDFSAGSAAGSAAACGARPTMTVRRPWPHSRLAAALASSSVTASTMALRFSI